MSPQQQQQPEVKSASMVDQILAEQAQVASRYMPVMSAKQAVQRRDAIRELKEVVLVDGEDYGKIPGTDKPTLLKPGAEKICAFFGYVPKFSILQGSIEDWDGSLYGEPLFYYHVECTLEKDRQPVGSGTGSCSSWERKYRYRASKRTCPACGGDKLIKGKPEWEKGEYKTRGSFICYEKKGGCGAKYYGDDQAIMNQPLGEVPNPDFADIINTVQKMADKRAYIAATLSATGASQWFTQDLEDIQREAQSIDTGGEQVGTAEAAKAVGERKIRELKKQASAPPTPAPTPSEPPMPLPWSDMSQMFERFAECKEQLGEPRYRAILAEHSITSAAAFKSLYGSPIPAQIYRQMMAEIEAKMPVEEPPEPPTMFERLNALAAEHRIGPMEASAVLAKLKFTLPSQVPESALPVVAAAFREYAEKRGAQ